MTQQVVMDTLGELYQNGVGFDGSLAFDTYSGATTSGASLMPFVSDYSDTYVPNMLFGFNSSNF
jgi:hypothetical protein